MTQLTAARDRLERADDLPALLEAAHQGFAVALTALRAHEDPDSVWFGGFVMAAAAGRGRPRRAAASPRPCRSTAALGRRTWAQNRRRPCGGRAAGRTRRGASRGISPRCAA